MGLLWGKSQGDGGLEWRDRRGRKKGRQRQRQSRAETLRSQGEASVATKPHVAGQGENYATACVVSAVRPCDVRGACSDGRQGRVDAGRR